MEQKLMVEGSGILKVMFAALAMALAALFVVGVHAAWRRTGADGNAARRAALYALAGVVAWLAFTYLAAASGRLRFDTLPPPMLFMVAAGLTLAVGLAVSPAGARLAAGLPLAVLVGFQSFRLPLELMMHRAYAEGLMPVQMSYSGYNFDIVTGVTAIVVAAGLATGRLGLSAVRVWNGLGILLLLGILVISFLSTPLPIRVFMNEPANVWITRPPFIWLPSVMVLLAVAGHIIIARRLRLERTSGTRIPREQAALQRR